MLGESYKSRMLYFDKHFPGWGGAMARWITKRELGFRSLIFALLACVPSHHQNVFRQKAATSGACFKNLSCLVRRKHAKRNCAHNRMWSLGWDLEHID
jgi:hypothetical protein